ncbi:MAG: crotonobetainyl-CoA--carnitine CoA-transferase [Chloroflexi bacterium]|nr:crotonobetainyl-CoA--carnitine CoA-transferase [Chloroflexota bacterium]
MSNNLPIDIRIKSNSSQREILTREKFYDLFAKSPIPQSEQLANLGLFLNRQTLSRILFMHDLYQKIIPIHGIVIEFGVRWGQNLALFSSFRGIYEPYNYNRKIVGFDTFSGFPAITEQDGNDAIASVGAYSVNPNYEAYLDSVLNYHETESPLSHLKKYEIIKGDATITLQKYLEDHPETIIALAYFDFDIYEPTKNCLELIKDHLTKGSVIGFDELNWPSFPGETLAFKEVLGLDKYSIRRSPLNPSPSYIVID